MADPGRPPAAFWLGSRTEAAVTDFDGRARRCATLGHARIDADADVLLVEADPPLPGQPEGGAAVIRRHVPTDAWGDMAHRWLEVFVGVVDVGTAARLRATGGLLAATDITPLGPGEVAGSLELLPPSPEQLWATAFAALERYVAREGNARVPVEHREGDLGLGVWVANQRFKHEHGMLTPQQAARLERLPGWEW